MRIVKTDVAFEKEQLNGAFGFKGSALTCLWQIVVRLETEHNIGVGLGVQSTLWSDAEVFSKWGEEESNQMMFRLTKYAVNQLVGVSFDNPFELFDMLYPKVYERAKFITEMPTLRKTFALNALVAVDFAAWQLWYKEKQKSSFDDICMFDAEHQTKLANIPLITYGMRIEEIRQMALEGTPLFKIKIGSDPDKDGDVYKMLAWDKARLEDIHRILKDIHTPYTEDGKIRYYLDANGRYDSKETLLSLLNFAEKRGIAERILLIEEPFDENNKIDIRDISYCFAADESAHSIEDVKERLALGYRALTLKPIAKTLSLTIRMHEFARKNNMISFCADLTVNPVMVSWNQCVAARLKPLKHMCIGVMESNGKQNYKNWEIMQGYHSVPRECSAENRNGIFHLGNAFYNCDGGIWGKTEHYEQLI